MILLAALKVGNPYRNPGKHWAEGTHFFSWWSWEMVSGHKL